MFEKLKKKGTKKLIATATNEVKKTVKDHSKSIRTAAILIVGVILLAVSSVKTPKIPSVQPIVNNYTVYNGPVYSQE